MIHDLCVHSILFLLAKTRTDLSMSLTAASFLTRHILVDGTISNSLPRDRRARPNSTLLSNGVQFSLLALIYSTARLVWYGKLR